MLSWDDSQTMFQYLSHDSSADTLVKGKLMMNYGYKYILAELNRTVTSKTKTGLTVASQQYYQLPPDYLFLNEITITVGGKAYPIVEEESQEYWDYLNLTSQTSDIPQKFFIRQNFGIAGAEIGIYPKPATAGNTITISYESTDADLSVDKYTASTITLVNGSATVTGAATVFTTAMVGRYLNVAKPTGDGLWYKVASFTSTLVMTLENVYEGPSGGGLTYQIAELFALPEEIQLLPVYYALQHYYSGKQNIKQEAKYVGLFDKGLELAKRRWGTKTRSAIIRGGNLFRKWPVATPSYFPSSAT